MHELWIYRRCRPPSLPSPPGLPARIRMTCSNSAPRTKPSLRTVTTAQRPRLFPTASRDRRPNHPWPATLQRHSTFHRSASNAIEKPWHDPTFMKDCPPEIVEVWLVSLLHSHRGSHPHKTRPLTPTHGVDATAYLRVLEAYSHSKLRGAPQKAEYWIGRLERHHADAVQSHLAKYGTETSMDDDSPNAPSASADALVALQPTVSCYNAVLRAWANDDDAISVVRARRWLAKLQRIQDGPISDPLLLHSTPKPDAESYDLYLRACSRGIGRRAALHRQRAEEAEDILRFRMSPRASPCVRPTAESFNYVVRAWTRCRTDPEVAEKVMEWVREMEGMQRRAWTHDRRREEEDESWKRTIAPNTKTYTMAMDAWVVVAGLKADRWYSERRCRKKKKKEKITPGTQQENRPRKDDDDDDEASTEYRERVRNENNAGGDGSDEMENAAALLKYIQALEGAGREDVRATVVGYNTLLSGWAKLANPLRPEVPLKSESILRDMMQSYENGNEYAAPDVMSLNAVIKAWGKTKRPNSASRCEWWLRKMMKGSGTVGEPQETASIPKPNVQTFNLVMEAWLQLGDPARVQDLLLEMDALDFVSPNSESFSKVIRAWLQDEMNHQHRHGLSGLSCENAWNWLNELLEREKSGHPDLGPAPELFSSILKTAARTKSSGENLLILGQQTFWAMRESRFGIHPLAYEWLLEIAIKVLHSPENRKRRQEFIESLVHQCCKDGMLSSKCVRLLKSLEEEDRMAEEDREGPTCRIDVLGDPPFPATWSRNISEKKSLPRDPVST